MSKSVREQVESCVEQMRRLHLTPAELVAFRRAAVLVRNNADLFASAEDLQRENARLRGVIEGESQWVEQQAGWIDEQGFKMTAADFVLRSRQLRLALHPAAALQPQPVQGGAE